MIASIIIHTIDLIWLPITWWVATKRQRSIALFFIILCILTLHLQTSLVYSTGQNDGFTPLWQSDVRLRGLVIYGIFCALYLAILHFTKTRPGAVLFSTALGVYFTAAITAMLLMAI